MSFIWPLMFSALIIAPLLIVGYVVLARRRNAHLAELAAQGFTPNAAALKLRRRRHIPPALFLFGLTLLLLSLARPQMAVSVPRREGTVILAFDVSNSMAATDLAPTRLAAAKQAAKEFVQRQPPAIRIGIVAFGNGALVTQQPTSDRTALVGAIDRLTPSGATSLGQGIFTSLSAIAGKPIQVDPAKLGDGPDGAQGVKIGFYGNAAIVLLSDGENTSDLDPIDVAKLASVAGVKVYPVGIGSPDGTVLKVDGFSVATKLDEDQLIEIAQVTDGNYYSASDAASLSRIYRSIDLKWTTVTKQTEVTGIIAAGSAVLLAIGAGLSLLWFGRVV